MFFPLVAIVIFILFELKANKTSVINLIFFAHNLLL